MNEWLQQQVTQRKGSTGMYSVSIWYIWEKKPVCFFFTVANKPSFFLRIKKNNNDDIRRHQLENEFPNRWEIILFLYKNLFLFLLIYQLFGYNLVKIQRNNIISQLFGNLFSSWWGHLCLYFVSCRKCPESFENSFTSHYSGLMGSGQCALSAAYKICTHTKYWVFALCRYQIGD